MRRPGQTKSLWKMMRKAPVVRQLTRATVRDFRVSVEEMKTRETSDPFSPALEMLGFRLSSAFHTLWLLPFPAPVTSPGGSAREKQRPPRSFWTHSPLWSGDPSAFLSTSSGAHLEGAAQAGLPSFPSALSLLAPLACSRPCFLYFCHPVKVLNQDF